MVARHAIGSHRVFGAILGLFVFFGVVVGVGVLGLVVVVVIVVFGTWCYCDIASFREKKVEILSVKNGGEINTARLDGSSLFAAYPC